MPAGETGTAQELRSLTVDIVSSYVSHNSVSRGDLTNIITSVHSALSSLGQPEPEPAAEAPKPAVPIRKSITSEYLISLEDGKQYRSLKRHLAGRGLTPDQYRTKWGLKPDYPMVAAAYSAKRSELARSLGLGRKRQEAAATKPGPGKRGRRKAA